MARKPEIHPNLDPGDWDSFRSEAHAALDMAIDRLASRSADPVWREPAPKSVSMFSGPLPREGAPVEKLARLIESHVLPFDVGNTHPRFWGWVHGAGTAQGLIPDIFASAMNANLGGRSHIANHVERQVIGWCREILGFPRSSTGLIVSGTSLATVLALAAARFRFWGREGRREGVPEGAGAVGYASRESHACVRAAFDLLGFGSRRLVEVPTDSSMRMDAEALEALVKEDLAAGRFPFLAVGTAGTVNTGAVDPLRRISRLCRRHGMWFHVDGAFGALARLDPETAGRVRGIELADSVAFDFHKWMHVGYDAGFVLVRKSGDLLGAFSDRPDYLKGEERGLAGGNPWFCEYGPELSRGFRALKVWFQLMHFGADRIGRKIADNCRQAEYLGRLVEEAPDLELLAPVGLGIVCFRLVPEGARDLDGLNREIVIRLQERGVAAPSTTVVGQSLAIRVNITNHRTRNEDLELLLDSVRGIGREILSGE